MSSEIAQHTAPFDISYIMQFGPNANLLEPQVIIPLSEAPPALQQSGPLAHMLDPQVMSPRTQCRELSVDITSTSIGAQALAVSDLAENAGHSWQAPAMPTLTDHAGGSTPAVTEGLTSPLCLHPPVTEDSHPWNTEVVNNSTVQGVKALGPSNEHLVSTYGSAASFCPSALMPSQIDASVIDAFSEKREILIPAPATQVMRGEHASFPFPPVPVDDDFDTPPCFANKVTARMPDLTAIDVCDRAPIQPKTEVCGMPLAGQAVPYESLKTSDMRVSFSSFPMDGGARVDDQLSTSGYPNVNNAGGGFGSS